MGEIDRADDVRAVEALAAARKAMLEEIRKVIIGQDAVIDLLMGAILARGHCLLVGVPGLAKTLIVRTLADAMRLTFRRIQFTPDLMPSDITGTDVIEEDRATGRRAFRFVQGPIFTNILLADEINRTPPKTQAALLEAMAEQHVTAGGKTHDLEPPFFVLATQNPLEQEGTYPLPEAQLDRFMYMVKVDYPSCDEERRIVRATTGAADPRATAVLDGADVLAAQRMLRSMPVSDHVLDYAVDLTRATRPSDGTAPDFVRTCLAWGAGPRAAQYLILGAKSRALMDGRHTVQCADVRAVAPPVLRHRVFTNFNADAEGLDADALIQRLLATVGERDERHYARR
ncbi:MAG: AAA domain-containing protein [Planctomycetes bacterium]|nr:AAA domain-containing protein [Planctomycetota bacterium]